MKHGASLDTWDGTGGFKHAEGTVHAGGVAGWVSKTDANICQLNTCHCTFRQSIIATLVYHARDVVSILLTKWVSLLREDDLRMNSHYVVELWRKRFQCYRSETARPWSYISLFGLQGLLALLAAIDIPEMLPQYISNGGHGSELSFDLSTIQFLILLLEPYVQHKSSLQKLMSLNIQE